MRKYMSKRQRPCDSCRSRKTACRIDSAPPCRSCQQHGKECTFLEAAQPRKRQQTNSDGDVAEVTGNNSPRAVPRSSEDMVADEVMASPTAIDPFQSIDMQFLQDFDMDGLGSQFMFQTSDYDPPIVESALLPESELAHNSPSSIRPELDGQPGFHPETLGLTGDMDPHLLRHYQTDEHGTLKFKQLAIRTVRDDPPVQFLISHPSLFGQSRQEAGHQPVQVSDARRELEKILPDNIGKGLMRLYQRFIAPHYPIFSDEEQPDPSTSPPCLLAAIYSISLPFAKYDDQLCIDMAYDSPRAEDLAGLINAAVATDIHSPTIATVQTLFLLVVRPSSNPLISDASYRWTTMGMLVSAAINVGLQLDPQRWNIPLGQVHARRRLSFLVYALDKWLAAALGRPPYVNRENWLVDELTIQDSHSSGLGPSSWADLMAFSTLTSYLPSILSRL